MSDGVFEFGPFRLDAAKRVLWRQGELLPVPPKALDILAVLVEQAGDVVTKQQLLERVWPDTFVEEANLSVNVSTLRKFLGEAQGGGEYIQTVPRRGYRFVGGTPGAGAALVFAVLPFRPLVASEEDAALGIGIADAVITRLAARREVTVRPTSAVLRYAASPAEAREAGAELGVDVVVEGRLQRHGERLRVTVQLVPLRPAISPWARSFDAHVTDFFDVQDRLAAEVAAAIALGAPETEAPARPARPTANAAAYQAYMRGRWFWSRFTREWMEKAFLSFQDAIERDAEYAAPHAGLADAYLTLGFAGVLAPRDAWTLAEAAATRAIVLDPALGEAHVSLAFVRLFQDWDWVTAARELERALAANPKSATVRQWRGLHFDLLGRFEDGALEIAEARRLDPLSVVVASLAGFQHYLRGDYAAAVAEHRATIELDPGQFVGYWSLGLALQGLGRHAEALDAHRRALELSEGGVLMRATLARSLALAGDTEAARAELTVLRSPDAGGTTPSYRLATIHAALDERTTALDCLERACEERDPWLLLLEIDPMFAQLRGEPRCRAVIERVFGRR